MVTEESFAMAECFESEDSECPLIANCALNGALREALNAFFAVLARHSIEDLVRARPEISMLLGLPSGPRAVAG
jgi:Rrf2 family iron-responsive transcriptional regulator